jgi:error-prone DNA polymerase
MFTHLHTRSCYSFLQGGSHPEALLEQASALGMNALALTDMHGVYGMVKFQKAARSYGIRPLCGAEIIVDHAPIVLLARSARGYAQLCRILTSAHANERTSPHLHYDELCMHELDDIVCLSGGYRSRLRQYVQDRDERGAQAWLQALRTVFGDRCYAELSHHCRPGESFQLERIRRVAAALDVLCVATGDVRYAKPDDYKQTDIMACVRNGITVFDDHAEREVNAEAYLMSEQEIRNRIPYHDALVQANIIAEQCSVDLLASHITPPAARRINDEDADTTLARLCTEALPMRYAEDSQAQASELLHKEIGVIRSLELSDYFLVVKEVVDEAKRRGIRCSGRGSAANSIVAYLLGITGVDPVRHHLLFERFLHGGRKGTPDIDVDFDSERREEVIAWMEQRFGMDHTAMTATLMTYRLRSAMRDITKAMGYPLPVVDALGKAVPWGSARSVRKHAELLHEVVPTDTPLFAVTMDMVERFHEVPRHLGLHSGGMVLSRTPLYHFSPIQSSANGVKEVQFDKNDVEAMGLVKLDVLGLRMLATISEAVELHYAATGERLDVDELSLDDENVYALMCDSTTIGVFQIESQGQQHVLALHQPSNFNDLIAEVALFRPGPLQSGMVNPYIRRRRGLEPVVYAHPDLEPILRDTYGVILYQEQVLEIAHHFAGMSLAEADDFRALMSKFRIATEMELMRDKFVNGAVGRGIPTDGANAVFDMVSYFVGYGFCRSHAAAFAKIVYQSAWLKRYYPACYMAAVMQHRPGFYPLMTLVEEAKRFGVEVLLPDVNYSGVRYSLEQRSVDEEERSAEQTPSAAVRFAIRKPLTSVENVSDEAVRSIVMERMRGPFLSCEDFVQRLSIARDVVESIARSGAMDALAHHSRSALWHVGVALRRKESLKQEQESLFALPLVQPEDVPSLPPLRSTERLAWDYATHRSARVHPITLYRRMLNSLEVRTIETCYRMPMSAHPERNHSIMLGGIAILRQQPGTAKGVMFLTLEDETGYIQVIVLPHIKERLRSVLRAPALIVKGKPEGEHGWRGLLLQDAWELRNVQGGYTGFPSQTGGKDRHIIHVPLADGNADELPG